MRCSSCDRELLAVEEVIDPKTKRLAILCTRCLGFSKESVFGAGLPEGIKDREIDPLEALANAILEEDAGSHG